MEATSNHLRSYIRRICVDAASPTDEMLWERYVRLNDENAFEVLIHRHGSMVLAVAQRVLADRAEAEDVFQATFLALANAKQKLRHVKALTSWLYQAAYRIAKRHRSRLKSIDETTLNLIESRSDQQDLAWKEVRSVLDEELQRLPDDLRSPLLLCYLNGLTRDEAAKQLGCSFDQLKRRLEKGRDSLRVSLERRGVVGAALALAVVSPELLRANVSAELIQKIMGVINSNAVVPKTISLLMVSADSWSKGVVMKSIVAAMFCVGVGVWGFASVGGGVEPQEKATSTPPPNKQAEKLILNDTQKVDDPDSRRAGSQQSRSSLNNLKQIMLAIHNFESAYGYLPSDILDKNGNPLLSWRVVLLPYLEQDRLYRQFKLDEPWDSESNLKLLSKMPEIYRVGFEPKHSTNTYYRSFSGSNVPLMTVEVDVDASSAGGSGAGSSAGGSGDDSPMTPLGAKPADGKKPAPKAEKQKIKIGAKISSIVDGTSNTLGVVEAGPAVPWTKPGGIPFDFKKPAPELTGPFVNVLHVGMMDGAVYSLKRGLPDQVLKILISKNDGLPSPDLSALRQPFPADTPDEIADLKKRIDANREQIKQLQSLFDRQLKLLDQFGATAESYVEADQLKSTLRLMEERLNQEIKSLESSINAKKKASMPPPVIPSSPPTPIKK